MIAATALSAVACQSALPIGKPSDWPSEPADAEGCLDGAEAQAFVRTVRDRVFESWALPRGVPAHQKVVLVFILDETGAVDRAAIFEASNQRLARSALRALEFAEPFPMTSGAQCVAGLSLVSTFENPILP